MLESMGTRIKAKREERDWTLEDLGKRSGVTASTVRKWETGAIKNLGSDKIQNLAEALSVTPAYLMGWSLGTSSVDTNNGIIGSLLNAPVTINGTSEDLSKEELEILRIYRKIGVKGRMQLLSYAIELDAQETEVTE